MIDPEQQRLLDHNQDKAPIYLTKACRIPQSA